MAHGQRAITRRRFVQASAVGSLALAGLSFSRASRAQTGRPNIVFIMADDLGYADLSCYGQRDYMTPNIDRLAIEGVRFTQGYANSAVCSATRAALITGRYQYRLAAGLEEPIVPASPKNAGLPPSHPTLPSLVKKVGYGTSLVGKWHLGFLPEFSPLKSGYDKFFGIFSGSADYFKHDPGAANPLFEQDVPVDRHGYLTNLLGDRAVQAVESYSKSKEPFLLSLHLPGTCFGGVRSYRGRSSFATGFSVRHSRLTSHRQRLESVDCRDRIVLRAKSVAATPVELPAVIAQLSVRGS
jgi:hypothetical protein